MGKISSQKTKRMVGMALFTGIILVLQLIGTFVKIGTFPVSLVLIPIVVGAAVYGPRSGVYLGGVFGVFVLLTCIFGWDPGGNILWNTNPLYTALLCIVKGAIAGLAAGLVYATAARKNTYLGVILAAIVCPVVNTGIFLIGMYFFFYDTLVSWAGGATFVVIVGLVFVNFLIELIINIILCPTVARIIKIGKTM